MHVQTATRVVVPDGPVVQTGVSTVFFQRGCAKARKKINFADGRFSLTGFLTQGCSSDIVTLLLNRFSVL
jgi:hypothetical protein